MKPHQEHQLSHTRRQLLQSLCEMFKGQIDPEVIEIVLIDTAWKETLAVETLFKLIDDVCDTASNGLDSLNASTETNAGNQFDHNIDSGNGDADNGTGPFDQTSTFVHRRPDLEDCQDVALPEYELRERIINSADKQTTHCSNSYTDLDDISGELASDNDIKQGKNSIKVPPKHQNFHENVSEEHSSLEDLRLSSEHDMFQRDDQQESCEETASSTSNGLDSRRHCQLEISNTPTESLPYHHVSENIAPDSPPIWHSEDDFSLLSMSDATSTKAGSLLSMSDITRTAKGGSLLSMSDATRPTKAGTCSLLSMSDATRTTDSGSMSFEIITESITYDSRSNIVRSLSFENIPDSILSVNVNGSVQRLSPDSDNKVSMDLCPLLDWNFSTCAHQSEQSSRLSANSKEFIPRSFTEQDTAQPHISYLGNQRLENEYVMPIVNSSSQTDTHPHSTPGRYTPPHSYIHRNPAPQRSPHRYTSPQSSLHAAPQSSPHRYTSQQSAPHRYTSPKSNPHRYASPQSAHYRYPAPQSAPHRYPVRESARHRYPAQQSDPQRYAPLQNTMHSNQAQNSFSSEQFQSNFNATSSNYGSMSFEKLNAGSLTSSPSSLSSTSVSSSSASSPLKPKCQSRSPVPFSPYKKNTSTESDAVVPQRESNSKHRQVPQQNSNYYPGYNLSHRQSKPLPQCMTFSDVLQHSLQNTGTSHKSPQRRPRRNLDVKRGNYAKLESLLACEKRVLVILRGCAGSGKSYLAQELVGDGIILASDDYFMQGQDYDYERALLADAHTWNKQRSQKALAENINPIIIDNTNTQRWEMEPYIVMALEHGYHVEIMEPETQWKFQARVLAKRNKHSVPLESIHRMLRRYEHHLTVEMIVGERKLKALMEQRISRLSASSKNSTSHEPVQHSNSHMLALEADSDDDDNDDVNSNNAINDNDNDGEDVNADDSDHDDEDDDDNDDTNNASTQSSDDIIILEELEEDIDDDFEADDVPNETLVADCSDDCTDGTALTTDHQDNASSRNNQLHSVDESTSNSLELNEKYIHFASEDGHDTEQLNSNQTTASFDCLENCKNEVTQILQNSLEVKPNVNYDIKHITTETVLDQDFESFVNCGLENLDVNVTSSLSSSSSNALLRISHDYSESPKKKLTSLGQLSCTDTYKQDENFEFLSTGNENLKREKPASGQKNVSGDWSTLDLELVWETPTSHCHGAIDSSEEFAAEDGGQDKRENETEMLNIEKHYWHDRMPEYSHDRPLSQSVINMSTCHRNDDLMLPGGKQGILDWEDPKPQRQGEHKLDKVGKYISAEAMNVNSDKKKAKSKGAINSKLSKHMTRKSRCEIKSEESFFDEAVLEKFMSTKWELPAVSRQPLSNHMGISLYKDVDVVQSETNFTDCATNTVPLDFNILHFLNQGVVLSQCETYFSVITGSCKSFIPAQISEERILLRVCPEISTTTDDLEDASESSKLEFVSNCFPDVSTDDLKAILISCHSDVDWAMNIMLDWGYDYVVSPDEKQKIAVNHLRASETAIDDELLPASTSSSPCMLRYTANIGQILSLTELCTVVLAAADVLNESNIQACLIRSGQKRLDTLEEMTLTRQLSLRSSHVDKQESVEDDVTGDDMSDHDQYDSLYAQDTDGEPVFISQENAAIIPEITPNAETTMTMKDPGDIVPELSDDSEEEAALSLTLPKRTITQLVQLFGPLPQPSKAGICMDIDYGTALKLYKCIRRAMIKKQQKEQTLSDAALARKLQEQEYTHSQNDNVINATTLAAGVNKDATVVSKHAAGGSKHAAGGNSLREIMDEQLAVQRSREDHYDVMEKNGDVSALSSKLKREKLLHMFPGVDENALEEVFEVNHYSLENTVKAIQGAVHDSHVSSVHTSAQAAAVHESQLLLGTSSNTAVDYEEILFRKTEHKLVIQQSMESDIIQESETDGHPDYQDFRAEAFTHHRLRQECFQKAQEAYRRGMKQVALFYSQQGHLHSVKLREANERASERILEYRNTDLDRSSVLDFHGLYANEAISLLEKLIIQRETEYQMCSDNKPLHLTVITGRGAHSHGGVAKLRPAIMKYLKSSQYNFTEPQPGVIKINLKYR